jgi:hypothetical protein
MPKYVHDWQPQIIDGIPGSPYYREDHAGDNGHNHFGFLDAEKARDVVQFLRRNKVQVTEWAGDANAAVGGHRDPGHYDGRSFDIPASQHSATPNRELEIKGMRRANQLVQTYLRTKGVPIEVLPYSRPDPQGGGPHGGGPHGGGPHRGTPQGGTPAALAVVPFSAPKRVEGLAHGFPSAYQDGAPDLLASALPATTLAAATVPAVNYLESAEGLAAADSGRSRRDTEAAYWQRADIDAWAKAHPGLAKSAGRFL